MWECSADFEYCMLIQSADKHSKACEKGSIFSQEELQFAVRINSLLYECYSLVLTARFNKFSLF